MARERFEKVKIAFEIETCKECPFVRRVYTVGAGCADDFHCCFPHHQKEGGLNNTRTFPIVMHYVEYSSDENPVPEWCKIRV